MKPFSESWKDLAVDGLKIFADGITLGIPSSIYESHIEMQVEKKIIERRFPFGSRRPQNAQYWYMLKLGETEKEVVSSLGLPYRIKPVEERGDYEYTFDEEWDYEKKEGFVYSKGTVGSVYFKNKILVAFVYSSALNETVRKGFPIAKQINVPVPPPPVPESTLPCPYCGYPLNTPLAKQCFFCQMDWHDPNNVIKH